MGGVRRCQKLALPRRRAAALTRDRAPAQPYFCAARIQCDAVCGRPARPRQHRCKQPRTAPTAVGAADAHLLDSRQRRGPTGCPAGELQAESRPWPHRAALASAVLVSLLTRAPRPLACTRENPLRSYRVPADVLTADAQGARSTGREGCRLISRWRDRNGCSGRCDNYDGQPLSAGAWQPPACGRQHMCWRRSARLQRGSRCTTRFSAPAPSCCQTCMCHLSSRT